MADDRSRLPSGEVLVRIPGGGLVPISLIVQVPEGMRLHRQDDGEVVGFDREGRLHRFDPPSPEAIAWREEWRRRRVEQYAGTTGATGTTGPVGSAVGAVGLEQPVGPTGPMGPAGPPGPPGTTGFLVVGTAAQAGAGSLLTWPVGTAAGDIALIMLSSPNVISFGGTGYTTHFASQSVDSASAALWSLYSKVLTEGDIPNPPGFFGGIIVMTMRNVSTIALKSVVHNTASMSLSGFTKNASCKQVISIMNVFSAAVGSDIVPPSGFVEQIEAILVSFDSEFATATPANYTDGSNPLYSGVDTTHNHGMALLEVT